MKVSREIVNGLKKVQKDFGKDWDVVKNEYKEIIEECKEELEQFSDKEKQGIALKFLRARYASEVRGVAKLREFEGKIVDKTSVRNIRRPEGNAKVMNLYGFLREAGKDGDWKFSRIAAWNRDTNKIEDLEVGKEYELTLGGSMKGNKYDLTASANTKVKEKKVGVPPTKKLIVETFPKETTIAEAEFKKGEQVRMRGEIISARTGVGKGNNPWGVYNIIDESIDGVVDYVEETGGFPVWLDASQVIYDVGSIIHIIGTIRAGKDGTLFLSGDTVIPYFTKRKEIERKEKEGEEYVSVEKLEELEEEGEEKEEKEKKEAKEAKEEELGYENI